MSKLKTRAFLLLLTGAFACTDAPERLFLQRNDTGITFRNDLSESDFFNIIQYVYYYNGAGVAAGDINNDGLPDLYFSANEGPDRLYLNEGDLQFRDITDAAGIGVQMEWSTGVSMADVNGDGWLDIYVCQLGDYKGKSGHNRLYINRGDLTFVEVAADYALDFRGFATQAAFFDYDRDGDLDVYLLNHSVHSAENYGQAANIRPERDALAGDRLMRNDGGRFTDVSAEAGIYGSKIGYGLGVAVSDINNDGWPDIYVSNDFHEQDYLYLNNGDGTFADRLETAMSYVSQFSMGNNVTDINNDGWTDVITLDMKPEAESILKSSVGAEPYDIYQLKRRFGYYHQYPRNMMHLNRGAPDPRQPLFSEVGQLAGLAATDWSWSVLINDLDNDGWKDVFISNGIWRRPNDLDYLRYVSKQEIRSSASDRELAGKMPGGKVSNYAFRNRGGWTFENVSVDWGLDLVGCSAGAALADLDLDGDADLILNNINAPAAVYENRTSQRTGHHFLKVRLQGQGGNTQAIGARVEVWAEDRRYVQELFPVRGYLSTSESVLLFGLGEHDVLVEVRVRWPQGRWTVERSVAVDQTIFIAEEETLSVVPGTTSDTATVPLIRPATDAAGIDFRHVENDFNDFQRELLLPHKLSTQGPKMAVGDVNGDGAEDLYLCGASGQDGALFLQQPDGQFLRSEAGLGGRAETEETDALLVDIDGDGDLDLYIVTGGGEFNTARAVLRDQLFFNDGLGHFSQVEDALPVFFANGSCVVPLDMEKDGDLDLFVGTRNVPGDYGLDPKSYLLQNDGQGHFSDVTDRYLPNAGQLGMVTDAALLLEAGQDRLVVVGEWMPVCLWEIGPERWTAAAIPNSEGWWNTVSVADLNEDGRSDLVLGNLGWNADLKASVAEPVCLYVKDFDENGKTDPILTRFWKGKEYLYASKDELSLQLIQLRKDFNDYATFAQLAFPQVFKEADLSGAVRKKAVTFATSVAINQGDGKFDLRPLPVETQVSPVFGVGIVDVDGDKHVDILIGGNLRGVQPALGMYAASFGTMLRGDGAGHFSEIAPSASGWLLQGEVRDIRLIDTAGGRLIVAAKNNDAPGVFRMARK